MKTRPIRKSDLDNVVEMHLIAFPDFFMSLMGKRFLREYYKCVIDYEDSITIIAENDSCSNIGFAVGFKNPSIFYKFLRSKFYNFIFPVLLGFIENPNLLTRILRGFVRVNRQDRASSEINSCELASIGVTKQSCGYGSLLLKKFIEEAIRKKSQNVTLTTDRNNNNNVVKFYTSNGFTNIGIEKRGNREMIKFIYNINQI